MKPSRFVPNPAPILLLATLALITPAHVATAQCQRLRARYSDPLRSVGSEFGNSVALGENLVVVGAPLEDVGPPDAGAVYLITPVGGSASFPAIQNPAPQPGDFFGYSVAVRGDRILVGAPGDPIPAPQSGFAYLYDAQSRRLIRALPNPIARPGGRFGVAVAMSEDHICIGSFGNVNSPGFIHVFTATGDLVRNHLGPTPMNGDSFGYSVAISEGRVLVGAPGAFGADGAAYLYDLQSGALVRVFQGVGAGIDPFFGWAVALDGDRVVIGAPRHDGPAPDTGIVFVFSAATGAITGVIPNPEPGPGDHFGQTVAISEGKVLIGAPDDDFLAVNSGSLWMFNAQTGALMWSYGKASAQPGDFFGHAVAFRGDEFVASAPLDNEGGPDIGSVYHFTCGPAVGVCSADTLLKDFNAPDQADFDHFGKSLAMSETHALIGAPDDDTSAQDAGSAHVFDLGTGERVVTLVNPDPTEMDRFGWTVALSGTTAVVGCPNDDAGGEGSGRAYVYNALTGELTRTLDNPDPHADDHFGFSVAASPAFILVGAPGDVSQKTNPVDGAFLFNPVNGDLRWTLMNPTPDEGDAFGFSVALSGLLAIVGAPGDPTGGPGAGSVYLFDTRTGLPRLTLNNPNPTTQAGFGFAVAASDGIDLLVGAFQDDDANNNGMAYLFDIPTGALRKTLTVSEPDTEFGSTVGIFGNRTIVGSPRSAQGAASAGRAYLFDTSSGTLTHIYNNPAPAAGDEFGKSLAVWGDRILIGSPFDGAVASNSGRVYLFGCVNGANVWTEYE